jgi:glutathione S-transferase
VITITAFKMVPPFAQGIVRDLRVRWALEEAGLPYQARLIDPTIQASAEYRALQPFGQVPAYEEDGFRLFETGSILLHIAKRSDALFPPDENGRARAVTWVFAALNSMEPTIQRLAELDFFYVGQDWVKAHRLQIEERAKKRLSDLAVWLGDREYLEDRFTVGDLMMTTVLRILRHTELLDGEPRLKAYRARCEERPAFQRALRAQMEPFKQP